MRFLPALFGALALLASCTSQPVTATKAEPPANAIDDERWSVMRRDIDELSLRFDKTSMAIERIERSLQKQKTVAPRLPMTKLVPKDEEADQPDIDKMLDGARREEPGTVSLADSSREELSDLFAGASELGTGRTDRALLRLRDFLQSSPRHAYADRAHRMVLEAHWRAKEWSLVISEANRIATLFPGTFAHEESIGRKASAERKLGMESSATRTAKSHF